MNTKITINFKNHHVSVNRKILALFIYKFYGVGAMSNVLNLIKKLENHEIVDENQLGLMITGKTSAERSANLLESLNSARAYAEAKLNKYIAAPAKRGCWAIKY